MAGSVLRENTHSDGIMRGINTNINLLKFIACFIVFFDHYYGAFYGSANTPLNLNFFVGPLLFKYLPTRILIDGRFMVYVFGVISGYLAKKSNASTTFPALLKRIVKRYIRFEIPIICAYLFFGLMYWTVGMHNDFVSQLTDHFWINTFYTRDFNIADVALESVCWICSDLNVLPLLWPMKFYLAASCCIYLFAYLDALSFKYRRIIAAFLIALLSIWDPVCLSVFLGALIKDLEPKLAKLFNGTFALFKYKKLLIVMIVLLEAYGSSVLNRLFSSLVRDYYSTCIAAVLFVVYLQLPLVNIPKQIQPVVNSSFSVYLCHWPILFSVSMIIFIELYENISFTILFYFNCFVTSILVLFIAILFEKFINCVFKLPK